MAPAEAVPMAAPGALFWAVSAGTPLLRSWRPRNHAYAVPAAGGRLECPGAADPGPPAPPEQRTGVGK